MPTSTPAPGSASADAVDSAADVALSAEQQRFFETFGYLVLRGAIGDVIDGVTDTFEQVWKARGGGHAGRPHDMQLRSCIVPFIDQHERLCALLDHPRVHGAAVSLLGDDFDYIGSDGNFYAGDTGWHRDGTTRFGCSLKFAIYLDALTARTGALRVVPGSHHLDDAYARQAGEVAPHPALVGLDGASIPAVALETNPGDLAIFDHGILHSAWGGSGRRRMFTINLCERFPEEGLPALQERLARQDRFLNDRVIGPEMLRTAGPGRMRHLEQAMANDFLLAERVQALKAQGAVPARG